MLLNGIPDWSLNQSLLLAIPVELILKTSRQHLPGGFSDWLNAESLGCLKILALTPVLTPHPHTFQ